MIIDWRKQTNTPSNCHTRGSFSQILTMIPFFHFLANVSGSQDFHISGIKRSGETAEVAMNSSQERPIRFTQFELPPHAKSLAVRYTAQKSLLSVEASVSPTSEIINHL